MRKIETKEELIDHLTRVSSAYRKSYKFYGILNIILQITGGIVGSTAILAIVPVISVFLAAVSVIPVVIGIITNATKLGDKKNVLKACGEVSSNMYINVGGNCSCSDKKLS